MDDNQAVKQLKALLGVEGSLKIITPFHACAGKDLLTDRDMQEGSAAADRCAKYAEQRGHTPGIAGGYRSADHYRLADVARIEESDKPGWFTAYADDELGTTCSGQPSALLARLTEHQRQP